MPINIPTYTVNNFSFGPARLFLGAAGTTPSVDVGGITEDGCKISIINKKKDIFQGNPKLVAYTFSQEQSVEIEISGIEWDTDSFTYAVGAGNTTNTSNEETFTFGGDPLVERVAIHIQHYMAVAGHTMNAYVWQAVSNGDLEISMGHDEHKFPYKWKAQRATTDWAGASLAYDAQLIKLYRQKT
ncbi:MAG TPA: hypothetical protein PLA94_25145 [Myxococcota bacterium]|nr:hypothetical protein [Myxococcota bacterium]